MKKLDRNRLNREDINFENESDFSAGLFINLLYLMKLLR